MTELVELRVGGEAEVELPYSEVCMHMRVAGKRYRVRAMPASWDAKRVGSVQILNPDGSLFSFPILPDEAGVRELA